LDGENKIKFLIGLWLTLGGKIGDLKDIFGMKWDKENLIKMEWLHYL
jgi:hypothetical protein